MKILLFILFFPLSGILLADQCTQEDAREKLVCYRKAFPGCQRGSAVVESIFKELKCYDSMHSSSFNCSRSKVPDDFERAQCFSYYPAKGTPEEVAKCEKETDLKLRLVCNDKLVSKAESEKEAESNQGKAESESVAPLIFSVRNNGVIKDDSVSDPASIGHAYDHGVNFTTVNAGLLFSRGSGEANGGAWVGALAANVDKSPSDDSKTKYMEANFGYSSGNRLKYAYLDAVPGELALRLKRDTENNYAAIGSLLDFDLIFPGPLSSEAVNFALNMGLGYDYLTKQTTQTKKADAKPDGAYVSGYTGATVKLRPLKGDWLHFLVISGQYQYFSDVRAPTGTDEDSYTFSKGSIRLNFYKGLPAFRPGIALERKVGTNPVDGTRSVNRTELSFQLLWN